MAKNTQFSIKALTPSELTQHLQNTCSFTGLLKTPGSILRVFYTAHGVYRTDFIDEDCTQLQTAQFLKKSDIQTLLLAGTPFQQKVWQAALRIPAGEVVSYKELACMIGNPMACRAVGTALGANPLVYLVPCHRIVCTDGTLGGFGAGLKVKRALLDYEALKRAYTEAEEDPDRIATIAEWERIDLSTLD